MIFPEGFTYLTIGFKIQLKSEAIFPKFKGSLLRGVLGKSMHDLSCREKDVECNECGSLIRCPYANLFKPELILKNQLVTVPFVIFSEDNKEFLNPEDTIPLQITLLGDFIDYMDYFLKSFHFAGQIGLGHKRAKFDIIKIRVGEEKLIYKDGKIVGNVGFDRQSLSAINGNGWQEPVRKLKIRFLSPVSIFKDKKHIYAPRIEDIIEYLVHRVNRLNKSIWRIDGYSLDRGMFNNGKINVTKYNIHYNKIFKSKGLGSKVELSGFTGSMDLSGELNSIYPLLKAGEVLHIGSRTSYGLGKYDLSVL